MGTPRYPSGVLPQASRQAFGAVRLQGRLPRSQQQRRQQRTAAEPGHVETETQGRSG